MHQQNRILDVFRVPEGRHPGVEIGHFPERATLALKSKRSQRAIVSAAFRKARAEQTRMRQQVRRHERAIAVATDAYAIAIADTHIDNFIDGRLRVRDELLDVSVVSSFAGADDRHRRVVENRIAGQQQEQVRITADRREPIGRAGDLAG